MLDERSQSIKPLTMMSGEKATGVFEERYKDNLAAYALQKTDSANLDVRAYEFPLDVTDSKSRRDFARFMVMAIGLGYSQATSPIMLPGGGEPATGFIQVYLQRSTVMEAAQPEQPQQPREWIARARSGPKRSSE